MIIMPDAAIESRILAHSSVESSSATGASASAAARQWRHLSGHLRVTSHASTRGSANLAFVSIAPILPNSPRDVIAENCN
jgi:hypothetical protein